MRRACAARLPHLRLRPQQARHRLLRFQEELGLRAAAAALRILPATAQGSAGEQPARTRSTSVFIEDVAAAAAAGGQPDRAAHRRRPGVSAWNTCFLSCTACRTRPTRATRSVLYHLLRHLARALPRAPRHVRRRPRRLEHVDVPHDRCNVCLLSRFHAGAAAAAQRLRLPDGRGADAYRRLLPGCGRSATGCVGSSRSTAFEARRLFRRHGAIRCRPHSAGSTS